MSTYFDFEVPIDEKIKNKFPLLILRTNGTSANGLITSANIDASCDGGFNNCLGFPSPEPFLQMGIATAIKGCADDRGCDFCVRAITPEVKAKIKSLKNKK